jgi:hypothetical protein
MAGKVGWKKIGSDVSKNMGKNRKASLLLVPVCVRIKEKDL